MQHDRQEQRSLLRNLWAFLMIAGHVLAPFRRRLRTRWGARPEELARSLPGDDLIPDANWGYTHAVSIAAPPEQSWPWIAQIGQGRGGFYTFEGLENLVGCRITNADTILPDYQTPEVGDEIRLHPDSPALHVAIVEPGQSLVLRGAPTDAAAPTTDNIWAFHVLADGPGHTRLVERGMTRHGKSVTDVLFFSPLLIEPIGFVMSREMLLGIKVRAEGGASAHRPGGRRRGR
jgi:hypothetical protein